MGAPALQSQERKDEAAKERDGDERGGGSKVRVGDREKERAWEPCEAARHGARAGLDDWLERCRIGRVTGLYIVHLIFDSIIDS